jgi:MFS family permease
MKTPEKDRNGDTSVSHLLHNKNFLFLWGGQAVSTLGTSISTLALPLLVLALTHEPTQAGLIAALQTIPYVVFGIPAGALVDRWNRKIVMIFCDIARCLAYGSVSFTYALLPRIVTPTQVSQATGLNTAADSAARILGPGISGFLISLGKTTILGAALTYLLDSLSYLVSILSLFCIRIPFQAKRESNKNRSFRKEVGEGLHVTWSDTRIRTLALLVAGTGMFASPSQLAVIVLAQQQLHLDARLIGLILSVGSASGLFGSAIASTIHRRWRVGQTLVGALLVIAIASTVLAIALTPLMLIVGIAFVFLAVPVFDVTQTSYRLTLTNDEFQGRVNSVFQLLFFSSYSFGLAFGGILLGVVGPRIELWIIAVGFGLSSLVMAWSPVRKA